MEEIRPRSRSILQTILVLSAIMAFFLVYSKISASHDLNDPASKAVLILEKPSDGLTGETVSSIKPVQLSAIY